MLSIYIGCAKEQCNVNIICLDFGVLYQVGGNRIGLGALKGFFGLLFEFFTIFFGRIVPIIPSS